MRASALLGVLLASGAWAHVQRSAYLEVVEQSPGQAIVTLRAQAPVSGLPAGIWLRVAAPAAA